MQTFSALLSSVELWFESESAVETRSRPAVALYGRGSAAFYGRGSADFSDCQHAALAGRAGEQPLWTFDKSAAKVEGARLLPV